MKCIYCGNDVPDGSKFCTVCGKQLPAMAPVVPAAAGPKKASWITVLAATGLMILALFLPLVKVSFLGMSKTINYLFADGSIGDGFFILLPAIVCLILVLLKKPLGYAILAIVTGLLGLILPLSAMGKIEGYYSYLVEKGIGYYLILLSAVALLAGGIWTLIERKKK